MNSRQEEPRGEIFLLLLWSGSFLCAHLLFHARVCVPGGMEEGIGPFVCGTEQAVGQHSYLLFLSSPLTSVMCREDSHACRI